MPEPSIETRLLAAITRAQSQFVRRRAPAELFDGLLEALLSLTGSQYGFIGEILLDGDAPYLKTHAITNIAWNRETRQLYEEGAAAGLEFRNLDNLFGVVVRTGEAVIANSPSDDPRGGGLPPGHPPLDAFLGLPFRSGSELIGMVGIANRVGGYDEALADALEPFLTTCSNLVVAVSASAEQERVAKSLRESEARGRAILDNAIDGIITIDQAGRIESCNQAACRIFDYCANELVGENVKMLMPESFARYHDRNLAAYAQTQQPRVLGTNRELLGRRRGGEEFPLELAVNAIELEGRTLFVGMLRDIGLRKAHEEQLTRLNSELSLRVDEMAALNRENVLLSELGNYLQACASEDEAWRVLLAYARLLFPRESGALYRIVNQAHAECVVRWDGEAPALSDGFSREQCWALRRGELHVVEAGRLALTCAHMGSAGEGDQLCVPVVTEDGVSCVLSLHASRGGDDFAGDPRFGHVRNIANAIADRLGPALSSIALRERLREDSIRDPLTKIHNRRFLDESLRRELRRASREGSFLTFIMLDIDHFKSINDVHGHEVGDQVLVHVVHTALAVVREEDVLFRYGGDEFAILLPGTELKVGEARAGALRNAVADMRMETGNGPLRLTVSCGVATFPQHGTDDVDLLRQADQALYAAKQAGRNCVRVAPLAAQRVVSSA